MDLSNNWIEQGLQQGLQQGLLQGEKILALKQLNRRFGNLPAPTVERIDELSPEQVEQLGMDLLDFHALSDLETWLNESSRPHSRQSPSKPSPIQNL